MPFQSPATPYDGSVVITAPVTLAPGSEVGLATGASVGIVGTPNVAVPAGVGIVGTPNVAVPAGVGIVGTPSVAVPAGVGIVGNVPVTGPGAGPVLNDPGSSIHQVNNIATNFFNYFLNGGNGGWFVIPLLQLPGTTHLRSLQVSCDVGGTTDAVAIGFRISGAVTQFWHSYISVSHDCNVDFQRVAIPPDPANGGHATILCRADGSSGHQYDFNLSYDVS